MTSEDDIEEQIFAEEDLLARFRQRYLTEYVFVGTDDDYHAQEEYAVRAYQRYWKKKAELLPVQLLAKFDAEEWPAIQETLLQSSERKWTLALRMSSKRRHRAPQPELEKRNEMDGAGGAVSAQFTARTTLL
jgi:hypothetical protein